MTRPELASTASQDTVRKAWEQFVEGKAIQGGLVAPHILAGWKISRRFGVDPIKQHVPPVLSKEELKDLQEQNKVLLQSAEPMLKMLEVSIRDTGYIATFAVASGHLLAVVGDDVLLSQARTQYNIPGAVRSIKTVGASALSLSITEKCPVQVTGYEHYNRSFHDWRCSAAPVFDIHDNPIASLTISSHISRPDVHTLTLARSCADGISIRLRECVLIESQRHLNAMLQSVQNALPESIVAINSQGAVTHANNKAEKHFSHLKDGIIGQEIAALFSKPDLPRVRQLLKNNRSETLELELLSHKGPANYLCRFVPIRLDNGEHCGMTLSISTTRQIIDIAKHVGGNYAKYTFHDIKGESPKLKNKLS